MAAPPQGSGSNAVMILVIAGVAFLVVSLIVIAVLVVLGGAGAVFFLRSAEPPTPAEPVRVIEAEPAPSTPAP